SRAIGRRALARCMRTHAACCSCGIGVTAATKGGSMSNESKIPRILTTAILLALGGSASTARADITVCNCSGADVIFEMTKSAPACTGQPWSSWGWWFVPHKSCNKIWTGDVTNQSIWWTAANSSTTWGDDSATWQVPNDNHNNLCFDWTSTFCESPGHSCRWSPHFNVVPSTRDIEIDGDPNNTCDTKRRFDCEH